MKTFFLSLSLIMTFMITAYSQSADSTLTLKKKQFYQNGQVKTYPQLKAILENNPASAPEYQKSKANSRIGTPIMAVGTIACLAGAAIGLSSSMKQSNDINNGNINGTYATGLPLVVVGAAAVFISLPFIISSNKHFKQSINDYNSSFKSTSYRPVQLNLMVNSSGVGINMRF